MKFVEKIKSVVKNITDKAKKICNENKLLSKLNKLKNIISPSKIY